MNSPFASNVAVVKYECANDLKRFKVQFFLNEKPLNFDWCNIGLCDLDQVIDKYRNFLNTDCSNIYCGGSFASSLNQITFNKIMVFAILLIYWIEA